MAKKRYKDFIAMKFVDHDRTRAGFNRRVRNHHSRPRGLRQPRKVWSKYADFTPIRHATGEPGWRCDTPGCHNHGFGPVLRNIVWRRHFAGKKFQCEPCIVRRLGRPLGPYDLRNCPVNYGHPAMNIWLDLSN